MSQLSQGTWPPLVSAERPMMGGRVGVSIADESPAAERRRAAEAALDRIAAWAGRLSRFCPDSELSRLNEDPRRELEVGPTLTAALDWARAAEGVTGGLVDATMLDARLCAEHGGKVRRPVEVSPRWSLRRSLRRRVRTAVVVREPGVRFDLDGLAKGWLADRALAIVAGRSAIVDGDGDVAIRVAPGAALAIGIADPRATDALLGAVCLAGGDRTQTYGLATSGTSVHRWAHDGGVAHHIIDPRTWRPAATDVVQATVLAASARLAEAFAKVAVIVGSGHAFARLDRPGLFGVLLLTGGGELLASPGMVRWLA